MDFHELLIKRRSIRRYTEQTIAPEDVQKLLEAALLSPTSKSARAWQLIAVEDRDTLTRLGECKPAGAVSVAKSTLSIVVGVDLTVAGPWIEDASVAASNIMMQAADLGIGSCWVQVYGRNSADGTPSDEFVREILGIPDHIGVLCIITLGYPLEERKPQDVEKLKWENVHIGKW